MKQTSCKIKSQLIILSALSLLFWNSFSVSAQSNSKFLSVCELLQNKKKYNGKKVLIESFLEIAPETSTFRFEENCSVVESIAVGNDDSFRLDEDFENAINLLSLQSKGEKKLSISLRWSVFLRIKLRAEGIFQTSKKPKFGHLNSYKNLFLITNVEKFGQSQLIPIEEIFSKNPTIIITNDNN